VFALIAFVLGCIPLEQNHACPYCNLFL
jgi:hypothetical protein